MIDLAEDAGAQFFFEQKIWDVSVRCNFAYWWNREEHGKIKKYDMVFGADGAFQIRHQCNAKSMFNYSQEFWILDTKN
jgi:kynurenine 3-monooxygenase